MKKTISFSLSILMAAAVLSPPDAKAQRRRILGSEELDDEDKKDEKEKVESAKESVEEKKKKEEAETKQREKEEQEDIAIRKAEEAAEKAAEEAAQKAKEEEERKIREAQEKEAARLEANREERLAQAKSARRFIREDDAFQVNITMRPGAPVAGKMIELQFDIAKKLKVESTQYGTLEPQKKMVNIAQVMPPVTGQKEEAVSYRVHSLETPGTYGFHFTPNRDGMHEITVTGKTKTGDAFQFTLPVHPDAWPPPDFEEEQKKLKSSGNNSGRTGRTIISEE